MFVIVPGIKTINNIITEVIAKRRYVPSSNPTFLNARLLSTVEELKLIAARRDKSAATAVLSPFERSGRFSHFKLR